MHLAIVVPAMRQSALWLKQIKEFVSMSISELLPSVQNLSHSEKLLLLKVLVGELLAAEGVASDSILEAELVDSVTSAGSQPDDSNSLKTRYSFLQKPLSERRQVLAAQADAMQNHYETNTEWKDLLVGDIVEY